MRLVIFALCLSAPPVMAALEWEQTVLRLDAAPLEDKVEAIFRFTNTGTTTVTIDQTHASCGCTVPTLERKTFAPGEAGEMRVLYTIGEGTVGLQEKTVTVQTADPGATTYQLTLRVDVPGLWEVQPKFVKWESGDEPVAKTVQIRALHPELARPVSVEARDARFSAALHESPDEPGLYVVSITPVSTDAPVFTSVIVSTNVPAEPKRVVQLYAVVR